jgi:pilus assembly protein CpaE
MMLKGAIICADEELSEQLERSIFELGGVGIVRTMSRYPTANELVRMLRASAPEVLFLSIESLSRALEIVSAAEAQMPGIQVVAINRSADPQTLLEVMRTGIREYLSPPFQRQQLYEALIRVKEALERRPIQAEHSNLVFSFIPSKPGVGTTTIATNAAVAVSKQPDQRSLLIDADLNSGMVRFLLQLDNNYSLLDAAERSFNMDENIWPQLVTTIGNLDVLHSGKLNPELRVEPTHVRHILDFARRNYKAVFLDLSGNFERYSIEAMQDSKRIFLVATPEIPSLHLAREKLAYLRSLELGERVSILLNRCQKRAVINPAQVQDLLGQPVAMTFANDYQGVHRALTAGKPVDPGSDLGRQFAQLAQLLLDKKAPVNEKGRSLAEYLSILPSSSLFGSGKKATN